ncbi:UNKNOWN [Stylonychia lemnae]|uniref:Uncharacterized protein n=1 Tax=Stylonychia lemnae TaxID=5949 RepID=A0A078A197_STYLE|nr:UNKNOWN [Stylonychia lemnae]|eukprot:CDW75850.1 UNKNOWN [Stylonychia lemnae]
MSNWFERYDQETYLTQFQQIRYQNYNPVSENNTFQRSNAFDLIVQQFRQYITNHMEIKKVIDPLSEICLSSVMKQLDMIKTVFETEGLLGMTEQFTSYCDKIIDFVIAEKFYIFTCVHMINSNNPRDFYRDRSLLSSLRIFYFLASLKQTIEEQVFGKDLNLDSIKELQQYMLGLFEILLGKLETYQYINPNIIYVCQKSNTMMEHLIDKEIHGDSIVKTLQAKFQQIVEEVSDVMLQTVNELRNIISSEIRKQGKSRDGSAHENYRGQYGGSPYESNMRKNNGLGGRQQQYQTSRNKSGSSNELRGMNENIYNQKQNMYGNNNQTPTSGTEKTTIPRGVASLFGRDVDQMTVAKSFITQKSKLGNKAAQMMMNKTNVIKDKKLLNDVVLQDENIDLDKIKKYFENVINEKHFLNNYSKARFRNQAGMIAASVDNESFHQQRQSDVQIAKKFFRQGLTILPQNQLRQVQEKARMINPQKNIYWTKMKKDINKREASYSPGQNHNDVLAHLRKTNFRGSNLNDLHSSRDNHSSAIGNMIFQGVGRQKTGIIKEHDHIQIYRGNDVIPTNQVYYSQHDYRQEYNNQQESSMIQKDRQVIDKSKGVMQHHQQQMYNEYGHEALDTKEFIPIGMQQHSLNNPMINSLAQKIGQGALMKEGILDNPVYKQNVYYPFFSQIEKKKKELEKNNNLVDGLYKKIKEQYTDRLANLIVNKSDSEEVKAILGEYFMEHMDASDDQNEGKQKSKNRENNKSSPRDNSKQRIKGFKFQKSGNANRRRDAHGQDLIENQILTLRQKGKINPDLFKKTSSELSLQIKIQQSQNKERDNQQSFGKKDRNHYKATQNKKYNHQNQIGSQLDNIYGDDEDDELLFQGDLINRGPENEFSDESLFGEDQIKDLLEKKQSFQRQANAASTSNFGESFIRDQQNKSSSSPLQPTSFIRSINGQKNYYGAGGNATNRNSQQLEEMSNNMINNTNKGIGENIKNQKY